MKKSKEIELLKVHIAMLESRAKRRRNLREKEFWVAINALKDGRPATLCVDGHFIPVLVSDVQVSRDSVGLTEVMIKSYPQPPKG